MMTPVVVVVVVVIRWPILDFSEVIRAMEDKGTIVVCSERGSSSRSRKKTLHSNRYRVSS